MTPFSSTTVVVIAKEPVPGRVKTRLTPALTPHQAAWLAEAALSDTLELVAALPVSRRVLALAGSSGDWLPAGGGFHVVDQGPGGLDERIAGALAHCDGPTLLIGMDTPQLTFTHLWPALAPTAWREHDAWLGRAMDGGFWALGLARPDGRLVRGVPMSTARTGEAQLRRLTGAGLAVGELPLLRDVDTVDDAEEVAALCTGRFAEVHAGLRHEAAP